MCGLNFSPSLGFIPLVEILKKSENVIHALPSEVHKEVQQDCDVGLRHVKPPKRNIPKLEFLSFKNLLRSNDLIISRAPTILLTSSKMPN